MRDFLFGLVLALCTLAPAPASAGNYFYGDSIPACAAGVAVPANCVVPRLAASTGQTWINKAISGSQAADQAVEAKSHAPVAGDRFAIYVGTNDANLYLADPIKRGYYRRALEYLIAWNATPTKTLATGGTLTAGWFADTHSAGVGMASMTPGDTATFTVSGTAVYVAMKYYSAAYGTADIKVDGVTKATYVATNPGYTTGLNSHWDDQVGLIRIGGLAAGSHTVQIAVTAGTGTYPPMVYLQWVAGSDQTVKPPIYVNTIHKWSSYSGGGGLNSAANIDAYNAEQDNVITVYAGDGHNVVRVDPGLVSTDISGDGIHPNDGGHGKIAASGYSAMTGPPPPPPTYTPAYFLTDGVNYFGAGNAAGTVNRKQLSQ